MKRILISIAIMGSLACATGQAHDFSVRMGDNMIYFAITDTTKHTAEVTFKGKITDNEIPQVKGTLEIPDEVSHKKVIYTITGIGRKAFKGASELKKVSLPATVDYVADFAFEDCANLNTVEVGTADIQFEKGSFFNCPNLRNMAFAEGMEDLSNFDMEVIDPDFNDIQRLKIPASVTALPKKIHKTIRGIDISEDNKNFLCFQGALYEDDWKVLSYVPCGRKNLIVKEGTVTVKPGALQDCQVLETLLFPSTLKTVSFQDLEPLVGLKSLGFKSEEPPATVYCGDNEFFLLTVPNHNGEKSRGYTILVDPENYQRYKECLFKKSELIANMIPLEDVARTRENGTQEIVNVSAENLISPSRIQGTDLKEVFR